MIRSPLIKRWPIDTWSRFDLLAKRPTWAQTLVACLSFVAPLRSGASGLERSRRSISFTKSIRSCTFGFLTEANAQTGSTFGRGCHCGAWTMLPTRERRLFAGVCRFLRLCSLRKAASEWLQQAKSRILRRESLQGEDSTYIAAYGGPPRFCMVWTCRGSEKIHGAGIFSGTRGTR